MAMYLYIYIFLYLYKYTHTYILFKFMHVYNYRYNIYNFEPIAHTCMHLLNTHALTLSHTLKNSHILTHFHTRTHSYISYTNKHTHKRACVRTCLSHICGLHKRYTACTFVYIYMYRQ